MKKSIEVCLFLMVLTLYVHAKSEISIRSMSQGALIYVDGVQQGIITSQATVLDVDEGLHEFMVARVLDEDWQEVERQNIYVHKTDKKNLVFHLDLEKISKKSKRHSMQNEKNFVRKNDIVEDLKSGLMWQDNVAVIEVNKNWKLAQEYCENLQLDGLHDWHLPTYDELITIVDYRKHTLAVMPAFKHVLSEGYWSATENKTNTTEAKTIYFGNGCPSIYAKNDTYFVRCVHRVNK